MRTIAAVIVAAIAAAGWLASQRAVALERGSAGHRILVVQTDYQQCTAIHLPPIRSRPQFRGGVPIADLS